MWFPKPIYRSNSLGSWLLASRRIGKVFSLRLIKGLGDQDFLRHLFQDLLSNWNRHSPSSGLPKKLFGEMDEAAPSTCTLSVIRGRVSAGFRFPFPSSQRRLPHRAPVGRNSQPPGRRAGTRFTGCLVTAGFDHPRATSLAPLIDPSQPCLMFLAEVLWLQSLTSALLSCLVSV